MIPKATEDTITSLLRDELLQLGVQAELFPVVNTPSGIRKPDILCSNGGNYPLEAKFSGRDFLTAIAKVQNDYLKHYKLLNVKGGFAILYPDQLANPMHPEVVKDLAKKLDFKFVAMFPTDDPRPFKVYDKKLLEVAKIIAELVLAPHKVPEPSIDYIIKSLREAAMQLLTGLRHLTSKDLEGFFGGEDVFKNILQYDEDRYPVEELKMGAAYLLVNQLLFYHAVSRFRSEFDTIDSDQIQVPKDLKKYFAKVLDVNYKTVFSFDVASLLPPKFSDEVRTIVNVIQGVSPEKVGSDLLGTIFHDLIPFETRKNVAAFYTNVLAAELLASLSIDRSNAKVADFSVGSGGLLVAAYRRKKSLLGEALKEDIHRKFVEEDLTGVDVMPFAANTAACHLSLQSPQYFTNKVRVAVWDSTDLRPGRIIPSVAELKRVLSGQTFLDVFTEQKGSEKGVVSLHKGKPEAINLNYCDVVIMNPPFTRQERIPEVYKAILVDRFSDFREYLTGQLGYHGYFVFLADRFLKEGGIMAMVLPATVLRVKSFEGLRRLWSRKYHVEKIITTLHRSAFSESVSFREMLIVARKSPPSQNLKTKIAVLKSLPETLQEARSIAESIRNSNEDANDEKLSLTVVDYSNLVGDTDNWYKFVAVTDPDLFKVFDRFVKLAHFKPLGSYAGIVRGYELRGGEVTSLIINSNIERAIKSNDVWILATVTKNRVVF